MNGTRLVTYALLNGVTCTSEHDDVLGTSRYLEGNEELWKEMMALEQKYVKKEKVKCEADDPRRNTMPVKDVEHETTLALDRAKSIVCGDRARDYGRPSENHKSTADLWTAYLRLPPGFLDERDVCVMNMLQKMSRDRWRRIDDNPTDWAGYAQNAAWVGDPRGDKTLDEIGRPE